jgi:glycosyltransferase involved in cell wall biosynthesis
VLGGIPTRFEPSAVGCWVVISELLERTVVGAGAGPGRVRVAQPGVDRTLFSPGPACDWRGELLYAGRIDPRKGIATAVRALASLPAMRLTIWGGGDDAHASELRALAAGLGVSNRVVFTGGPRARLADAYRQADAVLYPVEWNEPWGLVPLEAMASGTPVVVTGRGGSGEYTRDGVNALVVAEKSPELLAGAVRRLAGDAALRAGLQEGGLRTAGRYPADALGAAVLTALHDVAHADAARGRTHVASIAP